MRLWIKVIALALAIAAPASFALAGQMSQVKTFSGIPNFTSDLVFNKFDDNGGLCTLNWIKVILTLNVDGGQIVLDNDADSPASGTFEFGGKAAITGSTVPMLNTLFQPVVGQVSAMHSGSFSLDPNQDDGTGDYSPLPPDGMVYVGGPETDSDWGYIASTFFPNYTGAGTFTVTVATNQWQTYGSVSGIEMAITPVSASGSLEIIYDYTCVPEPSSVMALAGGLGVLGAMIRRRK